MIYENLLRLSFAFFFGIFICIGQCSCSLIVTKVCFYSSEDFNEDEVEAFSAADFNTDADAEVVKSRKSFLYNYFFIDVAS